MNRQKLSPSLWHDLWHKKRKSSEIKQISELLVEISGIEPLTFPAVNAGKPPKADLIEMQEVSGVPTCPHQKENSHLSVTVSFWWR